MAAVIHIMGRLGKDPESRFAASGQKMTTFSIATNVRRQGEEVTVWYRVTVFGERFDKMISFLKKGSAVYVVGSFDARQYQDKEGKTQTSLEVIADHLSFNPFGERSDKPAQPQDESTASQYNQSAPQFQPKQMAAVSNANASAQDDDDDLPF
jgi:single-strand DNA-binding protein